MQQTIDSTSETVTQAKGNFERFSARLLHLFSFVPDDKLDWTPSPTSRSPLRIVAHCALTSRFFADLIKGDLPPVMPPPDQFVKELHEAEAKITKREEAIALVNETTSELSQAIGAVNADTIDVLRASPFGAFPCGFGSRRAASRWRATPGNSSICRPPGATWITTSVRTTAKPGSAVNPPDFCR